MVEDRQVKNLSDADLIQRYLARRDQAAFLERHDRIAPPVHDQSGHGNLR